MAELPHHERHDQDPSQRERDLAERERREREAQVRANQAVRDGLEDAQKRAAAAGAPEALGQALKPEIAATERGRQAWEAEGRGFALEVAQAARGPETAPAAPEFTARLENGRVLLRGPDGRETVLEPKLPEGMREKAEAAERLALLSEIHALWREKAGAALGSMWRWGGMRSVGPEMVNMALASEQQAFDALSGLAKSGKLTADAADSLFWSMADLEGQFTTRVFGKDALATLRAVVREPCGVPGYGGSSYEGKVGRLYETAHTMTLNGGYAPGLASRAGEFLVATDGNFARERDWLENPEFARAAGAGDAEALKALGVPEAAAGKVAEAGKKARDAAWAGMDAGAVARAVREANPKVSETEALSLANGAMLRIADGQARSSAAPLLAYARIDGEPSLRDRSGLADLFANASGEGWLELSDDTLTSISKGSQELAIQAAIIMASAGAAGMALKGAAMAAGRLGAAEALGMAVDGGKVAVTGLRGWAAASAVEGAAFHLASVPLTNFVHKDIAHVADGLGDASGWAKDAMVFGALRGVGMALERAGYALPTSRIMQNGLPEGFVPAAALTGKAFGQVLTEAGFVTAAGNGADVLFGGEAHWTWEQYLKAVVLVGTMRAALEGAPKVEVRLEGGMPVLAFAGAARETVPAQPKTEALPGIPERVPFPPEVRVGGVLGDFAPTVPDGLKMGWLPRMEEWLGDMRRAASRAQSPAEREYYLAQIREREAQVDALRRVRVHGALEVNADLLAGWPHANISSTAVFSFKRGAEIPGDIDLAVIAGPREVRSLLADLQRRAPMAGGVSGPSFISSAEFTAIGSKDVHIPLAQATPELLLPLAEAGRLRLAYDVVSREGGGKVRIETEFFAEDGGLGLTNLGFMPSGILRQMVPRAGGSGEFPLYSLDPVTTARGYAANLFAERPYNSGDGYEAAASGKQVKIKDAQRIGSIADCVGVANGAIPTGADVAASIEASLRAFAAMPRRGPYVEDALANARQYWSETRRALLNYDEARIPHTESGLQFKEIYGAEIAGKKAEIGRLTVAFEQNPTVGNMRAISVSLNEAQVIYQRAIQSAAPEAAIAIYYDYQVTSQALREILERTQRILEKNRKME